MFHIVYFHPIHQFFFPTYESVVFRSLNRKIFRIIFLYLYRIYLEIFQQCGRKFSALGKISENSGSESENSRPPPHTAGFPTFSDIFPTFPDIFRHFPTFSGIFRLFYTHDGIFRCNVGKWHHGGEEQNEVRISLNRCLSKAFPFCSWLERKLYMQSIHFFIIIECKIKWKYQIFVKITTYLK